ncbi:hypothetical protein RirG_227250 [Rhizophagus irregularis DAOM 197198w]|uniref:DUF7869 domain-containing protein n=1 Tax=Rhizophagus irregularis (strain DAOM 197198w) TaxID=1432141 RepID=A0A015K726_RHIIW|nr:hypothetical protein RirG_227250 [Rhizophagus irregularis DAOM 197198w]
MVYNSLQKFAQNGKKHLQITCDNCTGQNKNNLSLWFWSWLVMLNWYEDITVNFMIPSHTKFICDSFFGHIKKVYWKHKVNTINDVKNIINNLPYSPQQVSSIYFKSAFSVHLFGVCKTEGGQNHQLNFVIGVGIGKDSIKIETIENQ